MRRNKWNAVKILLENYRSEGLSERQTILRTAKEIVLTTQSIYGYIRRNKFKFYDAKKLPSKR